MANYVIGIDYGTDSARAVLVDASNGEIVAQHVHCYPRWAEGKYCDDSLQQYRQHPKDYIESLKAVLHGVLDSRPEIAAQVKGMGVDFTGSTPCLVDKNMSPLSLQEKYAENPDAMFVLWKDHSGAAEAEAIRLSVPAEYLENTAGAYSPECTWAKLLRLSHNSPELVSEAYAFVDACDWICSLLTGMKDASKNRRAISVATAKMMLHYDTQSFPPREWFESMDKNWMHIVDRTKPEDNKGCNQLYGTLCEEYASEFGMSKDVKVACGVLDAFAGCIGACIKDGRPILTLGTSSGYMIVAPASERKNVAGSFSQGMDYVMPGMFAVEMGQSAYGDVFAWLAKLLRYIPASKGEKISTGDILCQLAEEAAKLPFDVNAPFATDFFNGRRSPDEDSRLWGSIMGLRLNSSPAELYRALVEATAFGNRAIIERMTEHGLAPKEVMCIGGISQKSPYVMQMLADVCGVPMMVYGCKETAALGAAMAGAAVSVHGSIEKAQEAMAAEVARTYVPSTEHKEYYDARYKKYVAAMKFTETQL